MASGSHATYGPEGTRTCTSLRQLEYKEERSSCEKRANELQCSLSRCRPSRTTSPLPRPTAAPRASRRRDGSSGLRNGREARATSLQIKRLLLSSAKCAASAGVRYREQRRLFLAHRSVMLRVLCRAACSLACPIIALAACKALARQAPAPKSHSGRLQAFYEP